MASVGFYLNYEECKVNALRLACAFASGFILTMRNVKAIDVDEVIENIQGFILTMRNVKTPTGTLLLKPCFVLS